MPPSRLGEFIGRLKALEGQMTQHLAESIDVHEDIKGLKTDMTWLKWLSMGISGGIGAIVVGLVIWAFKG